ncbi:MAG: DUF4956 domain-containing protein [Bacteroidetes bacterium]|nr:DUF4956 domain-containing protein [Bacteroidota bacterium]
MSELLDFSNIELATNSLSQYLIGFTLIIFLSLCLKKIYVKYSNSVSNKSIIADIFPLFSVSIYLIVITIKSSIVLSLGLVGALSIIRFRTAIKEAEQIVYFLILTGLAIAVAANSYIFPVVLILFVFVYNHYLSNKRSEIVHSVNDQLVISVSSIEDKDIDAIVKLLLDNNINVEIQSLNKNNDKTIIVFKLSDFRIDMISSIEKFIKSKKITLFELQFFSSSE